MARFDELTDRVFRIDNDANDDGLHYFRNIRTSLKAEGFVVRHSHVDWAAGVKVRAKSLRRNLDSILEELQATKVHIVAHSMGGLDARQMLFDGRHENIERRVASLNTLATPHHGSPAADVLSMTALSQGSILGIDISGLRDLTTSACRNFNEEKVEWERRSGVLFRAYAGKQDLKNIFGPLRATWSIIRATEGENDGLVSVKSAKWNDDYFVPPVIEADHLNIIGWWDLAEGFSRSQAKLEKQIIELYVSIAAELAERFPL